MNLHVRPDQGQAIQEPIEAGLIGNKRDTLDIGAENLRPELMELNNNKFTPQETVAHILALKEGNTLPKGVAIRDLINEGRA